MFQKKKGFTLIELLAVIVILAVIALIATPLIMNVINDAKKNSFKDSAYGIIKAVELRVMNDQIEGSGGNYKIDVTTDAITYSGDKPTSGWAKVDSNGVITLYMTNGTYWAYKDSTTGSEVTITSDSKETQMNSIADDNSLIELTKDGYAYVTPVNNCTYNGTLTQGAEYVDGQYTYRYMQEMGSSDWENISNDGWGVILTDKNSTDPVTTKICTTINGKPIVSMAYMFKNSQASDIDVSSFDTSSVTNMLGMFYGISGVTSLDLRHFDTSHVTNMAVVFAYSTNLLSVNLDNWVVTPTPGTSGFANGFFYSSSIENVSAKNWKTVDGVQFFWSMSGTSIKSIDVTGWDLSNLTSLAGVFGGGYNLEEIKGLNTWNTSTITDMSQMFFEDSKLTSLDVGNWNTSNVTTMANMFQRASGITSLDLSRWNTSNVTNMTAMFMNMTALTTLNLDNWIFSNIPSGFLGWTGIKTLSAKNWKIPASFANAFFRTMVGGNITSIDVTGWDLSDTTNLSGLFAGGSSLEEVIGLDTWNTSTIADMSEMFNGNSALTSLDLSSFDTSNVSNTTNMFKNLTLTTGYARTQADANKLNASSGKPSTLNFVLKTN